jgi:hypothetical protein
LPPLKELRLLVGLGVPGYMLARTYLHALTGVDPNNFNATLLLFTSITAGVLLALVHAMLGSITALVAMPRAVWQWVQSRGQWGPARRVEWADIFLGVFIVVFLLSFWLRSCFDTLATYVNDAAKIVVVHYEFAHDPTCAVSTEYRWVAPLKALVQLNGNGFPF